MANQGSNLGLTVPPNIGNYNFVPNAFEDNEVFDRYNCNINDVPCRFPVNLRAGKVDYYVDLSMVLLLHRNNMNHPTTDQPIDWANLVIDTNAQRKIEDEMTQLGIPLN